MEVGTVIAGKLRVERMLGRGGMGVVVVARHLQLNQLVAVKVLHDEAHDADSLARFMREGQASAQLRSEHVCRVFDVGTLESGAPYLVMELLEGRDLASVIAQRPMAIAAAIDAIVQASEAIAEAHALGIVHRDLKPANLFVSQRLDGSPLVKVLDFGIATAPRGDVNNLTQTSTLMGTPAFMSPEQMRSARGVDPRSDIWALGVILYQAVSARLPFPGTTFGEVTAKILTEPPVPLGVDPSFDAIVMRCLEKDPARRYQTVTQLSDDLRRMRPSGFVQTMASVAPTQLPSVPPYALPNTRPSAAPSRAPLYVIGAVAIVGIVAIAATRGGSTPPSVPGPAPSPVLVPTATPTATVTMQRGSFARALYNHRCADAKQLASNAGEQHMAAQCVQPVHRDYPHTFEGFGSAMADRDYAQTFAIGDELLRDHPEYAPYAAGIVVAACSLGDQAGALRYISKIKDLPTHDSLVATCATLGITLP